MQSVPITTKVVSSNPVHDMVHSIQHYIVKFVSDLRQVGGFLRVLQVTSTNKTDRHDITAILLNVALNTIKPNQPTVRAISHRYNTNYTNNGVFAYFRLNSTMFAFLQISRSYFPFLQVSRSYFPVKGPNDPNSMQLSKEMYTQIVCSFRCSF